MVSSRREVAPGLRSLKWCAFIPKCTHRGDGASCHVHLIHLTRPTPMQRMRRVAFVDLSMLCRKELSKLLRSLSKRRVSSSSVKNCEACWFCGWKSGNCYIEAIICHHFAINALETWTERRWKKGNLSPTPRPELPGIKPSRKTVSSDTKWCHWKMHQKMQSILEPEPHIAGCRDLQKVLAATGKGARWRSKD